MPLNPDRERPAIPPPRRRPTQPQAVRKGGLVALILLAMAVSGALLSWRMLERVDRERVPFGGEPQDLATYRFALQPSLLPAEGIVPSGLPRDGLPALDYPPLLSPAAADSLSGEIRGKYLVPDDRVLGLEVGGVARAYPLRMLTWHEVVNDTLGGRPVLVTYHPLGDACAAFAREIDGRVREFAESGLLYNSGLLMFARVEPSGAGGESLWSQLQARAVTGPAAEAALVLEPLPVTVARWAEWRRLHPATTVPRPAPEMLERYQALPYANYYGAPEGLQFPVSPLPPSGGLGLKDHVVAVRAEGRWRVFALGDLAREGAAPIAVRLGEQDLTVRCTLVPPTVAIAPADGAAAAAPPVVLAFWFAWYSQHPDAGETPEKPAMAAAGAPPTSR